MAYLQHEMLPITNPELIRKPIPVKGAEGKYILQDDASYPADWDIEYFKSLPSFKKRVAYAKEKLGHIGSGSSRIVFEIDPNTVLKLARNKKGLAQNELEADISDTGYHEGIIARVHAHDPDYLWIESEKARKMKKSDFEKATGYSFDIFGRVLINEIRKDRGGKTSIYFVDPEVARRIYSDEFFDKIKDFIGAYDLTAGDFARLSSWGIVNRAGKDIPVLIDYGVSQEIFKDFYLKKSY